MNKDCDQYIKEAAYFLKDKELAQVKAFFLFYLIAFCNQYSKIESWENNEKLAELIQEAQEKINYNLFAHLDVSCEIPVILNWIKKHGILKNTKEDVLGNIYLLYSKNEHRKRMGEHYTRIDLVAYIVTNCLRNIDLSSRKIIDPACGSGNFLIDILRKAFVATKCKAERDKLVAKIFNYDFIVGVDVQEVACLISSVRVLMEVIGFTGELNSKANIPIFKMNTLNSSNEFIADNQFDVVITNPPYLRYQSIEDKLRLEYSHQYSAATERFDLYTVFIEKAINLAKPNGKIIILCSDKFMIASYGSGIRNFINQNCNISKIYDLSSIYPFEAAVLSAIYIFEKTATRNKKIKWLKMINKYNRLSSKVMGYVEIGIKWRYVNNKSERVYQKINTLNNIKRFGDLDGDISIGIQTTADDVFCKKLTKMYLANDESVEQELIYPLVRGKDLIKWKCGEQYADFGIKSYILYPYIKKENKTTRIDLENYPLAGKYLLDNKKELESRYYINGESKKWFEHLQPRTHDKLQRVKILTPDLSSDCKFSLDVNGFFCNGTTYFISFRDKSLSYYKYLLAILNSSVINFFHKNTNTVHMTSKKYRFQTSMMKQYPIIELDENSELFLKIVSIVDEILNENDKGIIFWEQELNKYIYNLYRLNEKDILIIEEYLAESKHMKKI